MSNKSIYLLDKSKDEILPEAFGSSVSLVREETSNGIILGMTANQLIELNENAYSSQRNILIEGNISSLTTSNFVIPYCKQVMKRKESIIVATLDMFLVKVIEYLCNREEYPIVVIQGEDLSGTVKSLDLTLPGKKPCVYIYFYKSIAADLGKAGHIYSLITQQLRELTDVAMKDDKNCNRLRVPVSFVFDSYHDFYEVSNMEIYDFSVLMCGNSAKRNIHFVFCIQDLDALLQSEDGSFQADCCDTYILMTKSLKNAYEHWQFAAQCCHGHISTGKTCPFTKAEWFLFQSQLSREKCLVATSGSPLFLAQTYYPNKLLNDYKKRNGDFNVI